jgi:hypothetical protein
VYFVLSLYAPPRWKASARTLLMALVLATLWPNTRFGVEYGTDVRTHLADFETDMVAGVPSYGLAFRHWRYLHLHQDVLDEYMPMLRRAGVGSFSALQENPAFRKVSIPLVPQSLRDVRWDGGTAYSTGRGDASYVVFSLPIVEYAYGIRLRYSYWNEDLAPPFLSLYWRGDGHEEFTAHRSGHYSATGDRANWERGTWGRSKDPESTLTIWTCDVVKDIRIHPDVRPGVLRLFELVVLTPAQSSYHRSPC